MSFFVLLLTYAYVACTPWRTAASLAAQHDGGSRYRASVMAVLGSGGHTAEMIALLGWLPASRFKVASVVVASSDATSLARLRTAGALAADARIHTIVRAREVAGSWGGAVLRSVYAALEGVNILIAEQPALLLVNGPGTCVPLVCAARALRACGALRPDSRILFVESVCRVETLSLSGYLLYHCRFADDVAVQWEALRARFPRAKYIGTVL